MSLSPFQQQQAPLQPAAAVNYQRTHQVYQGEFLVAPTVHTARVAVVILTEEMTDRMEPFFIITNFRSAVLATAQEQGGSTFGVSENTFNRAVKATAAQQVACSSKDKHSSLLTELKALQLVGLRCVKANLAPLSCLAAALRHLGKKESDLKRIVNDMYSLVPQNILIDRPGNPVQQPSVAPPPPGRAWQMPGGTGTLNRHPSAATTAAAAGAAAATVELMHQCGLSSANLHPAAATVPTTGAAGAGPAVSQPPTWGLNLSSLGGGDAGYDASFRPGSSAEALVAASTAVGLAAAGAATASVRRAAPAGYGYSTSFDGDNDLDREPLPTVIPNACFTPPELTSDYSLQTIIKHW